MQQYPHTLFLVIAAFFLCRFGNAQINPVQLAGNAVLCFNNKLIYKGCNKEYRLDESGDLNIPCEATNEYCNGPCLSETKSMLKCITNIASNFLFNNGATTALLGNAIDNGCSNYIDQRETLTFIEGNDHNIQSRSSCGLNLSRSPPPNSFQFCATALILIGCCLLVFQHI